MNVVTRLGALVSLALAVLTTSAAAQPAPMPHDVSGTYDSTFGRVTLHQDGADVSGAYAARGGGTLHGALDGDTLALAWNDDTGNGRGALTVGPGGALSGTWGHDDDDHDGGAWTMTPIDTVAGNPIGVAAIDAAPTATPWPSRVSADVRIPMDVVLGPDRTHVAEGGVGVDLGRHVSDHWYSGVSADYTRLSGFGDDGSQVAGRTRVGGELRWYFAGTTAWLGYRVGAEWMSGQPANLFADASLGVDVRRGASRMGVYVSGGNSMQLPKTGVSTATPPAPPMSTPQVPTHPSAAPDFTIGLRFGF